MKEGIRELIETNPIKNKTREFRRAMVIQKFPEYVKEDSFSPWYLSLAKFIYENPLFYLRSKTIQTSLQIMENDRHAVIKHLIAAREEISDAIFTLLRKGVSWDREESLSLNKPESLIEFQSIWHPEYQRYIEHVFVRLLDILLFVLGRKYSKNYLELSLANKLNNLALQNLTELSEGADATIRNSISHGTIHFELSQIVYKDRKRQIKLTATEFSECFDALVDTCNSLLFSLVLFICRNQELLQEKEIKSLPLGLSFIYLNSLTSHNGMKLQSAVESIIANDKNQLNLVCSIASKSRMAHLMEAFSIAFDAEFSIGLHYDRYFINFDCNMPGVPAAAIDGNKLRHSVVKNEDFSKASEEIVESAMLWYDSSRFTGRFYLWKNLLIPIARLTKKEIAERWNELGIYLPSQQFEVLQIRNISQRPDRRIEAYAILDNDGSYTSNQLIKIVKRGVKSLRKHKIRNQDIEGEKGRKGNPRVVVFRLFAKKRRLRTLASQSFNNEELILIAEWISKRSRMKPFYTRTADIIEHGLRIRFNPKLTNKDAGVSSASL